MSERAPPRDTGTCPVLHTDYRVDRPALEHRVRLSADREAHAGLYWNDSTKHGFWMITRFADVLEALNMPEVFDNRQVNAFDRDMKLHLLPQTLNGREHRELRAVLNPFFAPAAVKRIEAIARERARALIRELEPRKSVDLVNEFGMQYPTEIFLSLLGLPTSDGTMMLRWVEDIFAGFFGGEAGVAAALVAAERTQAYFREAIAERERNPRNPKTDLVTRLLVANAGDKPIPREDVLTICTTLMAGGLDTTRAAMGRMDRRGGRVRATVSAYHPGRSPGGARHRLSRLSGPRQRHALARSRIGEPGSAQIRESREVRPQPQ